MKKLLTVFSVILSLFIFINISNAQTTSSSLINTSKDTYQQISSFDGTPTTTEFTNTTTGDIGTSFNSILVMMAIVIVVLAIFRILQGAVIKGTFDNIYNQVKGKSIIQNAGLALIIFIFAYAVLSFINPRLTGWNLATNFINNISSRTTSGGAGVCSPNKKYSNPNDITEMLKQDEGVKNTAYYDSLGIPSIGVGYNLTRSSDVKNELIAAGVSVSDAEKLSSLKVDKSKAGQDISGYPQISNDIVNKLLLKDIDYHRTAYAITFAKSAGKDYNSLPDNIKNVLTDMSFMGNYSDFVNMRAALSNNDYTGVAREIVNSQYCSQVGDRCSRLANLASPTYCETSQIEASDNESLAANPSIQEIKNDNGNTKCPNNTTDLGTIKTNYSGNPTIRLCRLSSITGAGEDINGNKNTQGAVVNAVAAQKFQQLGELAKSKGIQLAANSSFRLENSCGGTGTGSYCAKPGTSPHQLGIAIDFTGTGGVKGDTKSCVKMAKGTTDLWQWLSSNAPSIGIKQYSGESWHWDILPSGNRCG